MLNYDTLSMLWLHHLLPDMVYIYYYSKHCTHSTLIIHIIHYIHRVYYGTILFA